MVGFRRPDAGERVDPDRDREERMRQSWYRRPGGPVARR